METAHRKIELQNTADFIFLQSRASQSARDKIDLHFPPSISSNHNNDTNNNNNNNSVTTEIPLLDDPLRKRVEELVQAFLLETYSGVKKNISINGLEDEEMELSLKDSLKEEIEPFDSTLARKIQSVTIQIENLTQQLADYRRTAPERAVRKYTAVVEANKSDYEKGVEVVMEKEMERAQNVELNLDGFIGLDEERVDGVRKAWMAGNEKLEEVRDEIKCVVERLGMAKEGREVVSRM